MVRKTVVIGVMLSLAGCATGYQTDGFFGGFDESALAPNVYRVSFRGNGYTSGARAGDMALLRSADLTIQKGYRYFALADSDTQMEAQAYSIPSQSTTTFQANRVGNSVTGVANTTTYGGGIGFVHKPRANNIVVMFNDAPANGMAFDAAFVCQSIGAKYKVVCGSK